MKSPVHKEQAKNNSTGSCTAPNGNRYSRQCDQNGSTGDQKFSNSRQIGDYFKINNVVKDVGCIILRLKLVNW